MNKVYIIIVNWNGWKDTIECLESIFRNDYSSYRVIVCDNNSEDGSVYQMKSWAEGRLKVEVPENHSLRRLSYPPVYKPIQYVEYRQNQAEAGGYGQASEPPLILIKANSNLGFAGGNNVCLRYALARDDFSFAWLLNNDTVIEPDALSAMVSRMQEKPDAGMCGSTIPYYDNIERVWALGGGRYNKWLGKSCNIDHGYELHLSSISQQRVESELVYLAGASMLVSRDFLKDVGLICEDYFLYFEEPDWILRSRGRYKLAYAPESIVYHKVGASTSIYDSGVDVRLPSMCYSLRNRILFTVKFFPMVLPVVMLSTLYTAFEWFLQKIFNKVLKYFVKKYHATCQLF